MPRKIAVLGAGFFSQFHLDVWAEQENVQVVALCDTDAAKATSLANATAFPKPIPVLLR